MIFHNQPSIYELNEQFEQAEDLKTKVQKLHSFFLEFCSSLKTVILDSSGELDCMGDISEKAKDKLTRLLSEFPNHHKRPAKLEPIDFSESHYLYLVENNAEIIRINVLAFIFPKDLRGNSALDLIQALRWASNTVFQSMASVGPKNRLSFSILNKLLNKGNSKVKSHINMLYGLLMK